ncbi:MAG: hypothetical protein WBA65_12190 [Rhodanobacter sp.]
MNEFEWRRQLRDLQQAQAPRRDLWPAIDAALDQVGNRPAVPTPRRHGWTWVAVAASLALVVGAGWHSWFAATPPTEPARMASHADWKPADPRLAGAAIELDAARLELKLAIEQAPDSAALQRLLRHTERQQAQLRRLADRAS